jgi:hypothetical protein
VRMGCRLEEDHALDFGVQRIRCCQSVDRILEMRGYLRMKKVRGDCSIERTRNFEKETFVQGLEKP